MVTPHAVCAQQGVITKHSPGTDWHDVQNVGPSPLLIHKAQLLALADPWYARALCNPPTRHGVRGARLCLEHRAAAAKRTLVGGRVRTRR